MEIQRLCPRSSGRRASISCSAVIGAGGWLHEKRRPVHGLVEDGADIGEPRKMVQRHDLCRRQLNRIVDISPQCLAWT